MMKMTNKGAFVILAGGNSARMGGQKKELLPLINDKNALSMLANMLNKIDIIRHIHVVYAPAYQQEIKSAVRDFQGLISHSTAGSSRQESVYLALEHLSFYDLSWVMIHDGARPWLSQELIMRLYHALDHHDAIVPIIPLTDSLKRIDEHQMVIQECNREEYGLAQTPQVFIFDAIYQAHQALHGKEYSDDTAIYYAYHHKHAMSIAGDVTNKKLTYKEDLLR